MIRHVVLLRWEPHVTDEQVKAMRAALDGLAELPEVVAYRHGSDVGLAEDNADYAIVGDFADVAGYETYRDHPQHRRFIEDLLTGHVAFRLAIQFAHEGIAIDQP